jgi:hypothetical protein
MLRASLAYREQFLRTAAPQQQYLQAKVREQHDGW